MSEEGSGHGGSVVPPPVHGASPTPLWGVPDSRGRIEADGYVWGSPDSRYGASRIGRQASGRLSASPFASPVAMGMSIALLAYYVLQFATCSLLWFDSRHTGSGAAEGMFVYGAAAAVMIVAMIEPGRLRALFIAVAALAGAALPVYQTRHLFQSLGIHDVLVGQGVITSVLLPLIVGAVAVALLAKSGLSGR